MYRHEGRDCAANFFELISLSSMCEPPVLSSFPVGQYQHIRYSFSVHMHTFTLYYRHINSIIHTYINRFIKWVRGVDCFLCVGLWSCDSFEQLVSA